MANTTDNPDFSIDAKRKIAKGIRKVLDAPSDNDNAPRPAHPRSGGLPSAQYAGMVLQAVANNQWGAQFPVCHAML